MSIIFPTKYFTNIDNNWMIKRKQYQKLMKKSPESINNIPIVFIKEILNVQDLYNYVYKCFSIKNTVIEFSLIEKNIEDTPTIIEYNKKSFIIALDIFLQTQKLSNREKINVQNLVKTKDYAFFKENLLDQEAIPNIKYKDIIDLLSKEKQELVEFLKSETIFGLTKSELVEVLLNPPFNLSNELSLLASFNFEEELSKKIKENFEYIKYLYSKDNIAESPFKTGIFDINEVHINSKLEHDLLNEIPEEYNNLQKIYFIYKRLCQIFSYDEEFFAGRQKRMYSINHQNINRLKKINEDNNIVICYEITMILAKFCKILNIPFIILNKKDEELKQYGIGHTKLKFKVDDFVVIADPTDTIINSDMFSEKVYNRVKYFKLCNYNQRTIDKFVKDTKQVDEYFAQHKQNITFEDIKKIYNFNHNQNQIQITNNERLELFISIIKKTKTNMMDSIGYFLDTKKRIFNKERSNLCKCVYVSNTSKINFSKEISTSLIIIYNENFDVCLNPSQNHYILINSDKTLTTISLEQLQKLFDKNILGYINLKKEHLIPGIIITNNDSKPNKFENGDEIHEQESNFNEPHRKT